MRKFKSQLLPDFSQIKRAYFIGIKGVGMTALAQVLNTRGIKVSGSDTNEKFFTDEVLRKLKTPVFGGFRKSNVPRDADLVVASAAYYSKNQESRIKNQEVRAALRRGIPILTYPEALGLLFKESYGVAVAGTHGKSTTTAMLGVILEETGLDPTVIVGTRVNQWGSNARASRAGARPSMRGSRPRLQRLLVVEADEYKEAFLKYDAKGLIITSIEYDHPDYFKSFRAYKNAFRKLVRKIPKDGFIVANWDDLVVREVVRLAQCKVIKYGSNNIGEFRLQVPGEFNQLNAAVAAKTAEVLGVKQKVIKQALAGFRGTARRFEIKSPSRNQKPRKLKAIVVDDYAHHPTEIQVTLKTAREMWPEREIWVIFQPHTYSRTEALLEDFAKSFKDADMVFILETYASAREKRGGVGARALAREIEKHHPTVMYYPSIPVVVKAIRKLLVDKRFVIGDTPVIITMGAGDVWEVGEKLV